MTGHLLTIHTDRETGKHYAACLCGWSSHPYLPQFMNAARRRAAFHRTFATSLDATRRTA